MKYIKLFEEFILEGYSQKMVDSLVDRFTKEDPRLSPSIAAMYIEEFGKLKDSPRITIKDINQYTWKQLESIIDSRPAKRIKAGKVTVSNGEELYDKDGLRVYLGKDRTACIKYGNGYSWCISARGDGTMYDHYRLDSKGTPYFVFDDTKSTEIENAKWKDPTHAVVVFVLDYDHFNIYLVTDANNEGDVEYRKIEDVIKAHPKFAAIKDILINVSPPQVDQDVHDMKKLFLSDLKKLEKEISIGYPEWANLDCMPATVESYSMLEPILNGDKDLYLINFRPINLSDPDDWYYWLSNNFVIASKKDLTAALQKAKISFINRFHEHEKEDFKSIEAAYEEIPLQQKVEKEDVKKLYDLMLNYKSMKSRRLMDAR